MSKYSRRSGLNAANSPLQRAKARLAEQSVGPSVGARKGSYYLGPAPPPLFTPPSATNKYTHDLSSDIGAESIVFIDENIGDNDCKTAETEDASLRNGGDQGVDFSKDKGVRNVLREHRGNIGPELLSPAERSFTATAFEPYASEPAWGFAEASDPMEPQEDEHEGAAVFGSGVHVDGSFAGKEDGGVNKTDAISASPRAEALLEALLATQTSQAAQLTALREALVHLSATLDHLTPDLQPASRLFKATSGPNDGTNQSASDVLSPPSDGPKGSSPSANDESSKANATAAEHEPAVVPEPPQTCHSRDEERTSDAESAHAEIAQARSPQVVSSAHSSVTTTTIVESTADTAAASTTVTPPSESEATRDGPESNAISPKVTGLMVNALGNQDDAKAVGSIGAASAAELRAVGFTAQNCLASGITAREVGLSFVNFSFQRRIV